MNRFFSVGGLPVAVLATALLAASACTPMQSIDYEQILVGFNGPPSARSYVYRDRASLEQSWVKRSISSQEFDRLISKVDFRNQSVLAFAVGERTRVSGAVTIYRISLYTGGTTPPPMNVSVSVGIVESGCGQADAVSYPFAVAVFKTPEDFEANAGMDLGNFPDGCKVQKTGKPAAET